MDTNAQFLVTLGGILLLSLLTTELGKISFLPRVTLLLILGTLLGHEGIDLIPPLFSQQFDIIADMALLMVGFLLGGRLTVNGLKGTFQLVVWISVAAAVVTAVFVAISLLICGIDAELAILLGCLAAATDPAAVLDVASSGRYQGRFRNLLLAIVTLDDAWALILFALGLALASHLSGNGGGWWPLLMISRDIGGAVLLGGAIGVPASFLTGRIRLGEPMLTEALGLVFLCGGIALWLEVSFLIAAMVMGVVIANLARHHNYPFHAIKGIEWPFMVIFFVLAGASLEWHYLLLSGWIGIAYAVARIGGKVVGSWLGCYGGGGDRLTSRWMGIALLPQAGISIGMALVASSIFPQHRQMLLSIAISATIFFEIIGPVFTRFALGSVNRELAKSDNGVIR